MKYVKLDLLKHTSSQDKLKLWLTLGMGLLPVSKYTKVLKSYGAKAIKIFHYIVFTV